MFRLFPAVTLTFLTLVLIITTGTFLTSRVDLERELTRASRDALLEAVPPGNDKSEVADLSIAFSGRHGAVTGTVQSSETLLAINRTITLIQKGQYPKLRGKVRQFDAELFLPATFDLETTAESVVVVKGKLPSTRDRDPLVAALKKACSENELDLDTRELAVDSHVSRPSWSVPLQYLIPELFRNVRLPSLHLHGDHIAVLGGQVETTSDRVALERRMPTGLPLIGDRLESRIETIQPETQSRFRLVITPDQTPMLEGKVPTDAFKEKILKTLHNGQGSLKPRDSIQTSRNTADPEWIEGLAKVVPAFADAVWSGQLSFEGKSVDLTGKSLSSEANSKLLNTIRESYPEYTITNKVEVTPYAGPNAGNDITSLKLRNAVTETVVYFDNNRSSVPSTATADLKKLADVFNATTRPTLTIFGHSDPVGDPGYNRRLALERSQSVLKHLESIGVDPARMAVITKKEASAPASNSTQWKHERRVEFGLR